MKQFKRVMERARPLIQMTDKEARELWEQTKATEGVIVEIGTYNGGSGIILDSGKAKVYTIDINGIEPIPGTKLNMIIGESTVVAKVWQEPIDLLFIDGDHHVDSVRADLNAWLPHVKLKGKVIFHDYDSHSGVTLTVHRAIEDKRVELIKKVGSLLVTIRSN
jgi:predicted O-methyltransferase YrrM